MTERQVRSPVFFFCFLFLFSTSSPTSSSYLLRQLVVIDAVLGGGGHPRPGGGLGVVAEIARMPEVGRRLASTSVGEVGMISASARP